VDQLNALHNRHLARRFHRGVAEGACWTAERCSWAARMWIA